MESKEKVSKKRKIARGFKGIWIPSELWLDRQMTWMEKLMYAEVDSLCTDDGCFASNSHLAEFFQLSSSRCSEIISSLIEKGFLRAEYEHEGKNCKRRRLYPIRKTDEGYSENRIGGTRKTEQTYSENRRGVFGKGEREITSYEKPSESTSYPPAAVDKKNDTSVVKNPAPYLIDVCDKLNHIPRDEKVFKREMSAAKTVVAHTQDFLSHYGGDDLYTALDWIVKIAYGMKFEGHWYLKERSIIPSTIRFCLDQIMTRIRNEKERIEKSEEFRNEYEKLKKPAEVVK